MGEESAAGLPVQLTSFIGRERELAGIVALLANNRLVTLTGAGGAGKTRLAIEVARATSTAERFVARDFVDLAPLDDGDALARAMASALGVKEERGRPAVEAIAARIGDRPTLVVLDNCEHVVDAAARGAAEVLRLCRGLTVLATSREPLGVPGEVTVRMPSLSTEASAALFVDRAARTLPGLELTERDHEAIATICARLDGMPLAIELAAARAHALTPRQIADGLDQVFRILGSGDRTATPRQQTLLGSIEWSYRLLEEREQQVLRRMSVFAGGCTLAAVEDVAGAEPIDPSEVLEIVSSLVAKSLVVADHQGAEVRYRLLETIRQHAAELLVRDGADYVAGAWSRHRAHYRWLLERAAAEARGPDQQLWLARVEAEFDNIHAALHRADVAGDDEALVDLTCATANAWVHVGRYADQRQWLERALSVARPDSPHLADLLYQQANAVFAHDTRRAAELFRQAVDLYLDRGDRAGAVWALVELGGAVTVVEGVAPGRAVYKQARELAEQLDDVAALAYATFHEGNAMVLGGSPIGAEDLLEAAIRTTPIDHHRRWALAMHGLMLATGGRLREARALTEALLAETPHQDALTRSTAPAALGLALSLAGEADAAIPVLHDAVATSRSIGFTFQTLWALGVAYTATGDLERARSVLEEAVSEGTEFVETAGALGGPHLAEVLAAIGTDRERVRRLLDDAILNARRRGGPRYESEAHAAAARIAFIDGDRQRAEEHARAVLELHRDARSNISAIDAIEIITCLGLDEGDSRASGLLEAAARWRDETGYHGHGPHYDEPIARARAGVHARPADERNELTIEDAVDLLQRGRGARRRPRTGWDALTPAERSVVALVVEGRTNAQIGERLYISRHTVDSHLRHVFAKVGVKSRAELAAMASARTENGADA